MAHLNKTQGLISSVMSGAYNCQQRAASQPSFEVRLITPGDYPDEPVCSETLPLRFLKEQKIIPLSETDDCIELVVVDPSLDYPVRAVERASAKQVLLCVGVQSELQVAIDKLYASKPGGTGSDHAWLDLIADYNVEQLRDMASGPQSFAWYLKPAWSAERLTRQTKAKLRSFGCANWVAANIFGCIGLRAVSNVVAPVMGGA
ncbi:MAG: hypothetical protein KUG71_01575 [Porticoccaceae bacterium]|nr:hypothetical protein [Porticoccaceae bacterium]